MSKELYFIVCLSILWVALVFIIKKIRIKKVIATPVNSNLNVDIINDGVIAVGKPIVFNIIFDNENEVNLEIFSDLTLRYSDLISGNYVIPEHIKKNKPRNIIEQPEKTVSVNTEPVNDNIEFDQYVDISTIKNK